MIGFNAKRIFPQEMVKIGQNAVKFLMLMRNT